MALIKVFVFELDGELRVYPPVATLEKGDQFRLLNLTQENVTWTVAADIFTGGPVSEPVSPKQKKEKELKRNASAGVAVYQVKGLASLRAARGNSDPVIIIDI